MNNLIDKSEVINGLSYVQLESVLIWKKDNARPKDLKDIELIEAYQGNLLDRSVA